MNYDFRLASNCLLGAINVYASLVGYLERKAQLTVFHLGAEPLVAVLVVCVLLHRGAICVMLSCGLGMPFLGRKAEAAYLASCASSSGLRCSTNAKGRTTS